MVVVEKLKSLDTYAWEELHGRYDSRLRSDIIISLRKRGLLTEMTDDIAQQTWLTAVEKIGGFIFQGEDRLYHWLRLISLNHIRSLRRQQWMGEIPNSDSDGKDNALQVGFGVHETSLEDGVVLHERLSEVRQALRCLSPQARDIFLRNLIEGEKPEQLALRYPALKAHTISQIVFRTKQRIRSQCAERT